MKWRVSPYLMRLTNIACESSLVNQLWNNHINFCYVSIYFLRDVSTLFTVETLPSWAVWDTQSQSSPQSHFLSSPFNFGMPSPPSFSSASRLLFFSLLISGKIDININSVIVNLMIISCSKCCSESQVIHISDFQKELRKSKS